MFGSADCRDNYVGPGDGDNPHAATACFAGGVGEERAVPGVDTVEGSDGEDRRAAVRAHERAHRGLGFGERRGCWLRVSAERRHAVGWLMKSWTRVSVSGVFSTWGMCPHSGMISTRLCEIFCPSSVA